MGLKKKFWNMFSDQNKKVIKNVRLKALLWTVGCGAALYSMIDAWHDAGITTGATIADQASANCGSDVYDQLNKEIWRMANEVKE